MSRALAPILESARIEIIQDGYQLCGLCGGIMLSGKVARVVPRAEWYLIFSHEQCVGAVRGWKAVRAAERLYGAEINDNHDSANTLTPRLCWCGSCTCILDNERLFVAPGLFRVGQPYAYSYYEPKLDPAWYEPAVDPRQPQGKASCIAMISFKRGDHQRSEPSMDLL